VVRKIHSATVVAMIAI